MINNNALKAYKLASKTSKNLCQLMLHYKSIVKIGYNVNEVIMDVQNFFETLQDLHQL